MKRPRERKIATKGNVHRGVAFALLAAFLTTGCGSVQEHRARHRNAAFAELTPSAQSRILNGEVRVGDAPEVVYIALGTPQYTMTTPDEQWVWVYWGTRAKQKPGSRPGPPETLPPFYTRAELRFPRPGEEREELRLSFEDAQLVEWSLGKIDVEAAQGAIPLQLGTVPTRDRTTAK